MPTILLIGEERKGLPAELQAICDRMVSIPMVGESDSLNVAIATGVMLYEVFNQQRKQIVDTVEQMGQSLYPSTTQVANTYECSPPVSRAL